jgi:hypothetical protein
LFTILVNQCRTAATSTSGDFDARLGSLLEEQAAGFLHLHVLVEGDGSIVGRINLFDVTGARRTASTWS